jgi:hypothetical protein
MAFERFVKPGRIYTPSVSIWSRGQISFNQGCAIKYNLENYKYAILFYDRESRRIGIKFTNDETENGAIAMNKGRTGFTLSGNAFLGYYDIPHSTTRKYAVQYNDSEEIYVINLDNPLGNDD